MNSFRCKLVLECQSVVVGALLRTVLQHSLRHPMGGKSIGSKIHISLPIIVDTLEPI